MKSIDDIIKGYKELASSSVITIPDYLFKQEKPAWSKYHLQLALETNQQGTQENNLVIVHQAKDPANPLWLTLNIPVLIHQTGTRTWMERNLDKNDQLLVAEAKKGDFRRLYHEDRLVIGGDVIEQSRDVKFKPITSYKVYMLGVNSKQSYHVIKTLGGIDVMFNKMTLTN